MHRTWIATALLFITTATAQDYDHAKAVSDLAGQSVGKNKNVGIMVGIRDGETRWTHGFGRVSKPDGPAPDEDTLFEIGSITKVFNGILLADQVAAKNVALDDPLQKYLPSEVRVPKGEAREISLLDLVTHRSGLPRMPSNFRPKDVQDPYVDYGTDELYELFDDLELRAEPGEAYEYSNLATGLLGHALARANQVEDYAELLEDPRPHSARTRVDGHQLRAGLGATREGPHGHRQVREALAVRRPRPGGRNPFFHVGHAAVRRREPRPAL